jgi:short-subunit dehydrogenase
MSHSKTYLVTGASKGIDHGIVQSLLDHAPPLSTIYLTSRTPPKIIHNITSSILSYHPLDITTPSSIEALYKTIKEAGGIDVLVNNAGNGTGSVKEIVECNYYGTVNMCKKIHSHPQTWRAGRECVFNCV